MLKRRAKTANSKKARLANLMEKKQISQSKYLGNHSPKANAGLNQSRIKFVGHRKGTRENDNTKRSNTE